MKEYLINCGTFNIMVQPEKKAYYILREDDPSADALQQFIQGKETAYEKTLEPGWFKYDPDESWHDYKGNTFRLNEDLAESELVDYFSLKKFNFGSLVAFRDTESGKVKIFKRDKLHGAAEAESS